jgi:glutathione S-transferase
MANTTLVFGNRNYSSWSLRAWLALRKSGADFDEVLIPLDTPEFEQRIGNYSPSRKVPVLLHNDFCIWDSLAICEYVNDCYARGGLWPSDAAVRGVGRAMAAEMHSGFPQLRNRMPMNCRAENRHVQIDAPLQAELDRLFELWRDSLSRHTGSGWLLGDFSITDAMFAPVVLRLKTYGVDVPADLQAYCQKVHNDPDVSHWVAQARSESWIVEADEAGA